MRWGRTILFVSAIAVASCKNDADVRLSEWTQVQDYPGPLTNDMASAQIAGKGYVVHDKRQDTGLEARQLWEFDPNTNAMWKRKADSPPLGFTQGYFSASGKLFVLTGEGKDTYDYRKPMSLHSYDPNTDKWTALDTVPFRGPGKIGSLVAFGGGTRGYVSFYRTTGTLPIDTKFEVWRYDAEKQEWQRPYIGYDAAYISPTFFVKGTRIYFVTRGYPEVYYFDMESEGFVRKGSVGFWFKDFETPEKPAWLNIGNQAYLLTGSLENGCDRRTYEYHLLEDKWTRLDPLPATVDPREVEFSFEIGGRLYVGPAYGCGRLTDVWEYQPYTLSNE